MDCILLASQIIEKHREFNIPNYIAFIYFKKASDSVDRDKLWTIMSSKEIPTHLITIIQKIYRVSQEERTKLRESVPYVKLYRYNPKHLYPNLNGYGDNGQRKVWTSCISA